MTLTYRGISYQTSNLTVNTQTTKVTGIYRGQSYSSYNTQVDTVASQNTAQFLGQKYTLRFPTRSFKSSLGQRKYRGVVYGG